MAQTPERRTALLQEALDDTLSPEALSELRQSLQDDPAAERLYTQLRDVDSLLRTAPMERAPQALALRIMARLAEGLHSEQARRTASSALALAIGLVVLALTPLLAALGYWLITTLGSAAGLNALLQEMAVITASVLAAVQAATSSAHTLLQTAPGVPLAMLALLPLGALGIWRAVSDRDRMVARVRRMRRRDAAPPPAADITSEAATSPPDAAPASDDAYAERARAAARKLSTKDE
jgi:hypothetical protein